MWKNKKNGSSMVTILAVTLVLVFLSGVILKFAMGTMKLNKNQKESEDVQFAAEGGIELGRSYIQSKALLSGTSTSEFDFDTETAPTGSVLRKLTNELEKDKIDNVNVKSQYLGNDKILLTSIAKDIDGKEKTVKCKLEVSQANDNDIFDYGIVGGQGNVNIENIGGGRTNISSSVSSSNIYDENGNELNKIPVNEDGSKAKISKNKFGDLTFLTQAQPLSEITAKYSGSPHIALKTGKFYNGNSEIIPTKIEANIDDPKNITIDGKEYPINSLGNKNNIPSGLKLKHVIIMTIKGHGIRTEVEILMTNTNHLKLEAKDIAVDLNNVVILNKGTIEFTGTGSVKLVNSTVYGEDIKANLKTSFEVIGSLKNGLSDEKEDNLNKIIEAIMPGWNDVTNQSKGGVDIIKGSFES